MNDAPATFFYEKSDAFEELAAGENAIFESRTRLLVFAAALGYARDSRIEDHQENGEMRWDYIGQKPRLSVIASSLAYAATDDPEVLLDPRTQIDVLTSYAAGGSRILAREVVNEPGDNLDNLITFVQQSRDEERIEEQVGILEDIEREISGL